LIRTHLPAAEPVSIAPSAISSARTTDPTATASAESPSGSPADVAAAEHLLIKESFDKVTK
jgi:hypothetical protein